MCWSPLPAPVQPEVLLRVLADKPLENLDMPPDFILQFSLFCQSSAVLYADNFQSPFEKNIWNF
jgi:hypothetical protein